MGWISCLFPQHRMHTDDGKYSEDHDSAKHRPLPTPPSAFIHLPSTSELVPSSPPPPYSSTLPPDAPLQMSHDLSRPVPTSLAPEAPVIMTPPPSDEQPAHGRAPYDTFLCHSPPANTCIAVETSQSEYVLLARLPGFKRDGMLVFFSLSIPSVSTHASPQNHRYQEASHTPCRCRLMGTRRRYVASFHLVHWLVELAHRSL